MFRQGLRGDGRWVFGNRIVRRKDGGRAGPGGLAVVESGLWELGELWLPCGLWHVQFRLSSEVHVGMHTCDSAVNCLVMVQDAFLL